MAVDPNIKNKAQKIRTEVYGRDVRESLASGLEAMSEDVVQNKNRQNTVEQQFQDVLDTTTDKDFNSAPEIKAARGGHSNLAQRLLAADQQLADIAVNVKDFGAKGDGVADDQPAFQRAVNYLHSLGGGKLYAPSGVYMFDRGVKWMSKVSLQGNGIGNTILKHRGVLFSLIYNTDGAPNGSDGHNPEVFLKDCQFTDFTIDGSGLTFPTESADGKGIFILYMIRPLFRRVHIHDTIGTGYGCDFLIDYVFDSCVAERCGRNWIEGGVGQSGFGIGSCALEEEPGVVSNCVARLCGNYGYFVETQGNPGVRSKHAKFIGCHAEANRIGYGNKGSGGTIFSTSTSIKNEYGVQLTEGASGDSLINMIIQENTKVGLYISEDYVGDLSIEGGSISKNRKNIDLIGSALLLDKLTITNVEINEAQFTGVEFNRPIRLLKITGGTLLNNGLAKQAGYKQAMKILKDITNFLISNVLIADTQSVRTQLSGIEVINGVTLKNGTLANNDVSDYAHDKGLMLTNDGAVLSNVKTIGNNGYNEKQQGTDAMQTAFTYRQIAFPKPFDRVPSEVQVFPKGNAALWVTDITRSSFIARIETGKNIPFDWIAKL